MALKATKNNYKDLISSLEYLSEIKYFSNSSDENDVPKNTINDYIFKVHEFKEKYINNIVELYITKIFDLEDLRRITLLCYYIKGKINIDDSTHDSLGLERDSFFDANFDSSEYDVSIKYNKHFNNDDPYDYYYFKLDDEPQNIKMFKCYNAILFKLVDEYHKTLQYILNPSEDNFPATSTNNVIAKDFIGNIPFLSGKKISDRTMGLLKNDFVELLDLESGDFDKLFSRDGIQNPIKIKPLKKGELGAFFGALISKKYLDKSLDTKKKIAKLFIDSSGDAMNSKNIAEGNARKQSYFKGIL